MFGGFNHRSAHRAGAVWIIAALTLNVTAEVPSRPLFPAHCRVVLLAGLAGDLESETTFRDQLAAWCDLAGHSRHSELFLNKGYPLTLDEGFESTLPIRASTPVLPAVCTDTQGPLRWRIEWATISDGKLAARFHAELEQGELSKSDSIRFQQQLGALLSALGTEAGFAVQDPIAAH